jgi:hypothetical protein
MLMNIVVYYLGDLPVRLPPFILAEDIAAAPLQMQILLNFVVHFGVGQYLIPVLRPCYSFYMNFAKK